MYPSKGNSSRWTDRELGVVVVMTASIGDDIPRSAFAGAIYDYVLQATK
jgi:hypothetical protein